MAKKRKTFAEHLKGPKMIGGRAHFAEGGAFSGMFNNFNPDQQLQPQVNAANNNYAAANTGLTNTANQMQGIAGGFGPNPAMAQLNQATAANTANQAAMMAGQRGASANPALMARQAAMQGANLQQQAVGQGATMQANQSLNALNNMGNIYGTQAGAANTNYGVSQGGINAQNQVKADIAKQNAQTNQGIIGGIANGAMKLFGGMAAGGEVGSVAPGLGSESNFGFNFVSGGKAKEKPLTTGAPTQWAGSDPDMMMTQPMQTKQMAVAAKGGQADFLPFAPMMAGGMTHDYRQGGNVNPKSFEEEPVVHGDSLKNDKIPAMLSAHEIVIPRSITQGKNPIQDSAKFVQHVLQGKHKGKKK